MTSDSQSPTATAALLRAVADLIQTQPGVPLPRIDIDFYVCGPDAPATMAAIAAALPCGWQPRISRGGSGGEWLNLDSDPQPPSVTRGARVQIGAPTLDVCAPARAKTVTVWRPAAALSALIGDAPVGELTR